MKKNYLWMLAAILFGCLTFTSCSETDNPIVPEPEDEGAWTLNEDNMDLSIMPGDNFFMYCNGGWWNATDLGEEHLVSPIRSLDEQYKEQFGDSPSEMKLRKDLLLADDDTEAADQEQLNTVNEQIDACETLEELWAVMASLKAEGYQTPLTFELFSRNGVINLVFLPNEKEFAADDDDDDDDILNDDDDDDDIFCFLKKKNRSQSLLSNPRLLAGLQPLKGGIMTRGFATEEWPMLNVACQKLGIDPELVYVPTAYPAENESDLKKLEEAQSNLASIQDLDVDELKELMKEYVNDDLTLVVTPESGDDDDDFYGGAYSYQPAAPDRLELIEKFARNYLNYEVSYNAAQALITPEDQARTIGFCEELRQAFRTRIENSDWMGELTKANVLEKLNAMEYQVGAPDEWFEEGLPDVSQCQSTLEDLLAIRKADYNVKKKMMGMATSRARFHALIAEEDVSLADVNACYAPNFNTFFVFPAWMLPPLYDANNNSALNYATITVFGHEITHGFDNEGSRFDKNGDLGYLWGSATDEMEYNRRAQKLVELYSSLEVADGIYNDGAYTLAENIADLGGAELAYTAYNTYLAKQGLTGDNLTTQRQRFFLGYANLHKAKYSDYYAKMVTTSDDPEVKDEHSLGKERVNGIVINVDDWYDLFNVTSGSLFLAPEDRIHIW